MPPPAYNARAVCCVCCVSCVVWCVLRAEANGGRRMHHGTGRAQVDRCHFGGPLRQQRHPAHPLRLHQAHGRTGTPQGHRGSHPTPPHPPTPPRPGSWAFLLARPLGFAIKAHIAPIPPRARACVRVCSPGGDPERELHGGQAQGPLPHRVHGQAGHGTLRYHARAHDPLHRRLSIHLSGLKVAGCSSCSFVVCKTRWRTSSSWTSDRSRPPPASRPRTSPSASWTTGSLPPPHTHRVYPNRRLCGRVCA
jgi:hypothetical protein